MTIPKLDYYVGYPVEDVVNYGGGDWDWGITFGNDVVIRNADKRRTHAPEIEGTTFLMYSYGELDTVMHFGRYEKAQDPEGNWIEAPTVVESVTFTPLHYSITDPRFGDEEHFPQRAQESEAELPDDPSSERVVDGPQMPGEATEA